MGTVTNAQAMTFFRKFNQGEFPQQRLGQAFINHFKLDCNGRHNEDPVRTCLFHLCNDGAAAKRIWEEWVNG
jgi:hypothetical protein